MSSASTPQQQRAPSRSNHKDRGSTKSIWVSFVSGCLGGVANVLSSHPLDTIKVRMQILHLGFLKCCRHMIAKEGLGSLYKGMTSPLCNIPIIFAVYFGSYEFSKWLQGVGPKEELTVRQSMFAGAFSGFTVTSIRTPVELVKCRLQMEGTGQKGRTITALEMTKNIVRTKGYRELYKGTLITLLREVPAGALYFGTYEIAKKELKTKYGDKQFIPLVAGGLAGLFSWFVSYPQDVIKTKLQCDMREPRKYQQSRIIRDGGIASCSKRVWEKHGPVGFMRGFSACAMKTIVAEAATFFVYENTKKHIAL